ncbi:MAG TPA: hypothetical protein DCL35_00225 [Candidatus Omnitrophica bacterium]|nr:hypothetical protein [Candidatus Omnitrophota bacterium]
MLKNSEEQTRDINCWEFWNCADKIKINCVAHKHQCGKECWFVSRNFTPTQNRDFKYCWECSFFQKFNPDFLQ